MSKIGSWFRRNKAADAAPSTGEIIPTDGKPSLLKPYAKRDQALSNLQDGFNTLTDLMSTIKDNLNDQGRRQDELLKYLSHIPGVLEQIPETNRLQVDSLKAISARLEQQNTQQNMIAEILGKLADNDSQQRKAVEDVRSRVDTIGEQNQHISENLTNVSEAMQDVSQSSKASAAVLEQVRDNIERRDGQLEMVLHRQASRFTSLLIVAIVLSIAALVAVLVVGMLILSRTK